MSDRDSHYFDHNATTPLNEATAWAFAKALQESWSNPASPYRSAAVVANRLEEHRARLAERLGCRPREIIFTGGATEANNAVLRHFAARTVRPGRRSVLLTTPVEHPSVLEPARMLFGDCVSWLTVDPAGRVSPEALESTVADLREQLVLVSVIAANNETGVKQPVAALAEACRSAGIPLHCDATQWIGKEPLDELEMVDFVTASGHKFGGPKGVGFLRIPDGESGLQVQLGGGQEHGHRGGTVNFPAIEAMAVALEERSSGQPASPDGRDRFERELRRRLPDVTIVGGDAPRLGNTSNLILPRHDNHRWVARLDRAGFAVSTGSACATAKEGPSHVLRALGWEDAAARRAVRVSGGWSTTESDWLSLAEAFVGVAEALDAEKSAGSTGSVVISI